MQKTSVLAFSIRLGNTSKHRASISSTTAVYCSKIVQILHSKRHQRLQSKTYMLHHVKEVVIFHCTCFASLDYKFDHLLHLLHLLFCKWLWCHMMALLTIPFLVSKEKIKMKNECCYSEILRPVDKSYQLLIPNQNCRTFCEKVCVFPHLTKNLSAWGGNPKNKQYKSS